MIDYDRRGTTAHVTLDRPAKKNALAGLRDLHAAFERAETKARAVVLHGAGDAFCAGDDIASIATLGAETDPETLATGLYRALFGPEQLSVPVVAAVDEAPADAVPLVKRYAHAVVAADDERERLVEGISAAADSDDCLAAARAFLER